MTKSGAQAACDSLSFLVAAGGASAAFGGFGFALNTAATFDVFYWLQVTNYGVLYVLFDSPPSGSNPVDVWDLCLHVQMASPNYFVATVLATSPRREQAEKAFLMTTTRTDSARTRGTNVSQPRPSAFPIHPCSRESLARR